MNISNESSFLFARPSFLSGVARIVDLGGTMQIYNENEDADNKALENDFIAVGKDINNSIKDYVKEQKQEQK